MALMKKKREFLINVLTNLLKNLFNISVASSITSTNGTAHFEYLQLKPVDGNSEKLKII
jgi:hypothetical protein